MQGQDELVTDWQVLLEVRETTRARCSVQPSQTVSPRQVVDLAAPRRFKAAVVQLFVALRGLLRHQWNPSPLPPPLRDLYTSLLESMIRLALMGLRTSALHSRRRTPMSACRGWRAWSRLHIQLVCKQLCQGLNVCLCIH